MKRGANHTIGKGETSGTWSTEFRKWNSKKAEVQSHFHI